MSRKAAAGSVALLLGLAFLVPIWAAAAYENDDAILILFGLGFWFPIAAVVILLALIVTTMAYFMRPFHRESPWTFAAAFGMGGVLSALAHGVLSGRLDIYERSYAGFWFAFATAATIGIVLGVAAPRRQRRADHMVAPTFKPGPPSPPR